MSDANELASIRLPLQTLGAEVREDDSPEAMDEWVRLEARAQAAVARRRSTSDAEKPCAT